MQRLPALRRPRFWLWLCLSAWPPELIAQAAGWDLMDPRYLGLLLAWWPLDTLGRLGALALLVDAPGPRGRLDSGLLRSALAAEVLLGLKASALALLGLVPALAILSFGRKAWLPLAAVAAIAGLLPAARFALRRLLAPLWLLRQPLNAGQALAASARQTSGRFRLFLGLALPWVALSWALDGLGLALPEGLALALAPLSLACGLLALARADRGLA